jgi:K+-transporting ATPase ATPase C chain
MNQIITSFRLLVITVAVCCVAYPLFIMIAGKIVVPHSASGSLIKDADGNIIGSELVAQSFKQPEYLWPRPSAVDYNGAGAGGSNKSPTNPAVRERAMETLKAYGVTAAKPIPADLVAASGGGLDPHITLKGALFQSARIAEARGMEEKVVQKVFQDNSFVPGGVFAEEPIVNVLKVNLALDELEEKGL